MGQYYHPTSIDACEHISTHAYNNGMKLMEHSWVRNNMINAICNELMEGGRWYKHRIAWIGDYADGPITEKCQKCINEEISKDCCDLNIVKRIIGECTGDFKALYERAEEVYFKVPANFPEKYFVNNHTKKEFVDITKIPTTDEDWKVHPLPILTAAGNGAGGGDYDSNGPGAKFIGSWCGNSISVSLEPMDGFKEIRPDFHE